MVLLTSQIKKEQNHHMSVLIIHPLHPGTDSRQDFVGYRTHSIAQHRHRQIIAEDDGGIALTAIYVRHVYHADIHANVAHIRGTPSVDQTIRTAAT